MKKIFYDIYSESLETKKSNQILQSLQILICVGLSQILFTIVFTIFPINDSINITLVFLLAFISPLSEEIGRYISIKCKNTLSYAIVFNLIEFFSYLLTFLNTNISVSFIYIIFVRLSAVLIHFINTLVQKFYFDRDSKIGFYVSLLIHIGWNFFHSIELL